MRAILLHQGTRRRVYALAMNNNVPIYQEELYPLTDEQKGRIAFYIEFLSNSKFPVVCASISKKLKGYTNLYELRPFPFRLFFFMMNDDAIITQGIIKKKNKTDKSELQKSDTLRIKFIEEHDDNATIH